MLHLEPELMRTVVMIGQLRNDDPEFIPTAEIAYDVRPAGTGVLIGYKDRSYCVTVKHIIERIKNPVIFINNKGGQNIPSGYTTSQLKVIGFNWTLSKEDNMDLAVIPIKGKVDDDLLCIGENRFKTFEQISEGEEVIFFGFPQSITRRDRIIPFHRQGMVGLNLTHSLSLHGTTYPARTIFIDATVTIGNSGSPVFTKPSLVIQSNGIQLIQSRFIGIASSNVVTPTKVLSERDALVKENAGIGILHSVDHILNLLNQL